MSLSPSTLHHYKDLVIYKAYADFRAEAERTYLGIFWWVAEPLIDLGIYYLVFGIFLNRGTENFVPFLLIGLVMWRYLSVSVTRASNSIIANAGMIQHIHYSKLIFPIISILTCSMEFVFSLIMLACFMVFVGDGISIHILAFPIVLAVEIMLILGLTIPLTVMVSFFPDLHKLITYLFRVTFFVSGILYPVDILPESIKPYLYINPFISLVDAHRATLMYHQWPNWMPLLWITLASTISILIGLSMFKRCNGLFAKRIIR